MFTCYHWLVVWLWGWYICPGSLYLLFHVQLVISSLEMCSLINPEVKPEHAQSDCQGCVEFYFKSGFLIAVLGFKEVYCSDSVLSAVLPKVSGIWVYLGNASGSTWCPFCLVIPACLWCRYLPGKVFLNPRGGGSFGTIQQCFPLVVFVLCWTSGYSLLSFLPLTLWNYLLLILHQGLRCYWQCPQVQHSSCFVPNKVASGRDVDLFFLLTHFSSSEPPAQCAGIIGMEESRHSLPQIVLLSVKTAPYRQAGVGTIRDPGPLPFQLLVYE